MQTDTTQATAPPQCDCLVCRQPGSIDEQIAAANRELVALMNEAIAPHGFKWEPHESGESYRLYGDHGHHGYFVTET